MSDDEKVNYGLRPEVKAKYKSAVAIMSYSQLFEEYEWRAMRSSGGYLDPISKGMLKIVRKELVRRLEGKDPKFKAGKKPPVNRPQTLLEIMAQNKNENDDI